mgnify:CR=1 FL=1
MRNVQKWSWVVAVAGFLFGFDTVVISGANEPIRELWDTSALFHGTFIMSMALWGTVLGSLFGGKPLDTWGRKPTLIWIGALFTVSAIGSGVGPLFVLLLSLYWWRRGRCFLRGRPRLHFGNFQRFIPR